jgi:hypothetical protein
MVQLNMSDDEYDKKVKIVIGGLLHRACPLTKSVLQQFDPSATRNTNASHLSSSKLKLEALEPCAEFLSIVLADCDTNKIYTKSTLKYASRDNGDRNHVKNYFFTINFTINNNNTTDAPNISSAMIKLSHTLSITQPCTQQLVVTRQNSKES